MNVFVPPLTQSVWKIYDFNLTLYFFLYFFWFCVHFWFWLSIRVLCLSFTHTHTASVDIVPQQMTQDTPYIYDSINMVKNKQKIKNRKQKAKNEKKLFVFDILYWVLLPRNEDRLAMPMNCDCNQFYIASHCCWCYLAVISVASYYEITERKKKKTLSCLKQAHNLQYICLESWFICANFRFFFSSFTSFLLSLFQ